MAALPVACSLTPEALAARKANLLPGLVRRADQQEDLADGLRLRFPADAWPALAETIDAERRCCRFLRFAIEIEPDGGPIVLSLTGPSGTRDFLSAMIQE